MRGLDSFCVRVARAGVLLGLCVGVALGAACDSETDNTTGGAGPPVDPLVAELCPAACATVKSCAGDAIDAGACEAQCAVELSGQGYLVREIAIDYFQSLRDAQTDPDCQATHWAAWRLDPARPDLYHLHVDDPAALDECVQAVDRCFDDVVQSFQETCFLIFYRYNLAHRDEVRACFAVPCAQWSDCTCTATIAGEPWVTLPPPPPQPGDCPPP